MKNVVQIKNAQLRQTSPGSKWKKCPPSGNVRTCSCGYRETVSRTTNARCPVCHKRMEMVGKGEDARFVCSCGHKERLSKFQERRKKEGAESFKKDVNAYLKKQQKEAKESINNAFRGGF